MSGTATMIPVVFPASWGDGPVPVGVRALATQIAHDSGMELRRLLPAMPSDTTVLFSLGSRVIPGLGYGASALDRHTISFVAQPESPAILERIVGDHLRHALFHEAHHLVRGWVKRGGLPRRSFIDGVICEGLASAFERDPGGYAPPWCDYPGDVPGWIDELLALPVDADYRHWMFHHPDSRRWIGYKAGTCIADRAIARSRLSAAQLVAVPTARILELAGLPQPGYQLL